MISQRQLFLSHLAQVSPAPLMLEIEKAEGLYLTDNKGKKYADLISGIAVSSVGHRHPKVIEAIKQQLDNYMHLMVYGEYVQSPQVKLAQALISLLPKNLDSCYFVNSGAEAVEGALKLAKRYTGRSEILAFKNAYHGSTQGALSVMGNEELKNPFRPLLPGVQFLEFNKESQLEIITRNTSCVIVETIQGEAGIRIPEKDFLKQLRTRCYETETLLILDEIQCGIGRTGKMFAFEHYEIEPDILCLAKALGGGMPIGAFVSSNKIMRSLSENPALGHITTFGGHPVCCAAAYATIKVVQEEKLLEGIVEKERLFRDLLKHKLIKEIRGKGLFLALQFESEERNKKIIQKCIEKGVITDWFLFCTDSMRIAPPLTITHEEIMQSCAVLLECMDNCL